MNEVLQTVIQIGPLKVPCPDGMHIIFYHKCLDIAGKSIYNMISVFFHHGHLLRKLNETYITRILKKQNPTKVNDFRECLPKIISSLQSAFV